MLGIYRCQLAFHGLDGPVLTDNSRKRFGPDTLHDRFCQMNGIEMLQIVQLLFRLRRFHIVEFLFDKSWDGYTKTAIFKAGSVELSVKLTDDRCIIPAECLKQAGVSLHIGVSGVKEKKVPL